jgi:hypothetical protein
LTPLAAFVAALAFVSVIAVDRLILSSCAFSAFAAAFLWAKLCWLDCPLVFTEAGAVMVLGTAPAKAQLAANDSRTAIAIDAMVLFERVFMRLFLIFLDHA